MKLYEQIENQSGRRGFEAMIVEGNFNPVEPRMPDTDAALTDLPNLAGTVRTELFFGDYFECAHAIFKSTKSAYTCRGAPSELHTRMFPRKKRPRPGPINILALCAPTV